MNITKQLT